MLSCNVEMPGRHYGDLVAKRLLQFRQKGIVVRKLLERHANATAANEELSGNCGLTSKSRGRGSSQSGLISSDLLLTAASRSS